MNLENAILIADNHHGIYCPQVAITNILAMGANIHGDSCSNQESLKDDLATVIDDGHNHEWYWDSWSNIETSAEVTYNGLVWRIYQDGDVWLVPIEVEPTRDELISAALEKFCHDDSDIGIDSDAKVSECDDGSYWVQGWLLVDRSDISLDHLKADGSNARKDENDKEESLAEKAIAAIEAFSKECEEIGYTDTGEAWEIVNMAKETLKKIILKS